MIGRSRFKCTKSILCIHDLNAPNRYRFINIAREGEAISLSRAMKRGVARERERERERERRKVCEREERERESNGGEGEREILSPLFFFSLFYFSLLIH